MGLNKILVMEDNILTNQMLLIIIESENFQGIKELIDHII